MTLVTDPILMITHTRASSSAAPLLGHKAALGFVSTTRFNRPTSPQRRRVHYHIVHQDVDLLAGSFNLRHSLDAP